MKTQEITEWVTELDRAHGLVRAVADAESGEGASAVAREALALLSALHARMLRAEVRSVVSSSAART
ncbi:MAG: hypothetical protein U0270_30355 [Labilithrix sp.]